MRFLFLILLGIILPSNAEAWRNYQQVTDASQFTQFREFKIENSETIARSNEILTEDALDFIFRLQDKFCDRRKEILNHRIINQKSIDDGVLPDFLDSTKHIRNSEWKVSAIPQDLKDRRVEITGPVDR